MPLIVQQILLFSTIRNVLKTVWKICILMLGCKGIYLLWFIEWLSVEITGFNIWRCSTFWR